MMGMGRLTAQERFTGLVLVAIALVVVGFVLLGSHRSNTPPPSPPSATPPSWLMTPKPQTYTPAPRWTDQSERDFLQAVHLAFPEAQLTKEPGQTDAVWVDLGHSACTTLRAGATESQVTDVLANHGPTETLSESDVRLVVRIAESNLCYDVAR